MPDRGASILARLKNKSKASGVPYQQYLQLLVQEEFLRRLSKSGYAERLVLKGGLFIYTLTDFTSRATVDVDFLMRQMDRSVVQLDAVIAEILATETGNNEVILLQAIKATPISVLRKYPGMSTQIIGRIKNVRVPFDVDIGMGDVIVPEAQKRIITTQLDGFEAPEIYAYTLESTIAEKLDAILQRYELTGRMKDFYDIYYLSLSFDFDGRSLQEAIVRTFENRGTSFKNNGFGRIASLADDLEMQVRWRYFLKTIHGETIQFKDVMLGIETFLRPVYDATLSDKVYLGSWSGVTHRWT
jgi:predicted nucleotidyltransferase component of viral defense system